MKRDSVQVWRIPLQASSEVMETYYACLSLDERSRADRFRFSDDRRRFIVARGVLRHLLGQSISCSPTQISFCYGQYGKPSIEPVGSNSQTSAKSTNKRRISTQSTSSSGAKENCDFHFNISHSGELALCALGYERKVGIDVEKLKEIKRLESMMDRCLSSQEQKQVKSYKNPLEAFLTCWTCKEAYLKAIGLGLSQSMTTVEVDIEALQLVRVPKECEEGWKLRSIAAPKGYIATLAVAGDTYVEHRDWVHADIREDASR